MNAFAPRLRIAATDSGTSRVFTRQHQFMVGRPLEFDVEYPHVTAIEHALGALGAEIVGGLHVFARRRRVELDHVEAVVDGEVENALTYLEVVGEAGYPGLSRVSIKVYVASPHEQDELKRLWDDAVQRLPLVRTFRNILNLSIELTLTR